MPRLNVLVSADRSKNRAAMRNAPIRSPTAYAVRILSVLQIMPSAQRRKDANVSALAELD